MDHPLPWLRYVDADNIDDATVDFDGLKVRNDQMETLGKVEGFIVDSTNARPYYVVVDSGGWFKSKHYLLPVGHARMDGDNDALVVDLSKERIDRFPGFDKGTFEKMSDADLQRFNDETCSACSPEATSFPATDTYSSQWNRPQYAEPEWWSAQASLPDPSGAGFAASTDYVPSKVAPVVDPVSTHSYQASQGAPQGTGGRETEASPYFDGRAQPGDVIGLETGGERTHVGETADDENKRRRDAEAAARKDRG